MICLKKTESPEFLHLQTKMGFLIISYHSSDILLCDFLTNWQRKRFRQLLIMTKAVPHHPNLAGIKCSHAMYS